jgi:hypothetical protein
MRERVRELEKDVGDGVRGVVVFVGRHALRHQPPVGWKFPVEQVKVTSERYGKSRDWGFTRE